MEYSRDDNGNLLSDGQYSYSNDDANRLVEINNGSTTASYIYNGLGDRLQSAENGTTTTYHLDLAVGLTQVLDDGQHTYLYGNGRVGYSNDDMYYFLGDAPPLAHPQGCGSVRAVVQGGEDAPVMMTRDYAPYGEVLDGRGTNPTPYGYTGEWADASGLVFLRARYDSSYSFLLVETRSPVLWPHRPPQGPYGRGS